MKQTVEIYHGQLSSKPDTESAVPSSETYTFVEDNTENASSSFEQRLDECIKGDFRRWISYGKRWEHFRINGGSWRHGPEIISKPDTNSAVSDLRTMFIVVKLLWNKLIVGSNYRLVELKNCWGRWTSPRESCRWNCPQILFWNGFPILGFSHLPAGWNNSVNLSKFGLHANGDRAEITLGSIVMAIKRRTILRSVG